MADPRTFTLIGEFKDGITPELEKINRQITALKTAFAGVGNRKNTGFRGATQEVGKLVAANKNLSRSFADVSKAIRSTNSDLIQYRKEVGKAVSATKAFQKAGGNLGSSQFAQNMREANREANRYLQTLRAIGKTSPPRQFRAPAMASGRGMPAPTAPGGLLGGGNSQSLAGFTFSYELGQNIARPVTSAIVKGFEIGVGLMTKPFQYFAGALGERVQDELSDIQAAGGLLSVSRRQETPFLRNFQEAMRFTQDTNKEFAKMAAALPGSTQQYVEIGKRLSDTAARIVANDTADAIKEASKLRVERGLMPIADTGRVGQQQAIQEILLNLTKSTTLAGLGQGGGAGRTMGAYGLPQLTERMIGQDTVSMGQFQRYAAIFRDPAIQQALERFIPEINKTQRNTIERFQVLDRMYKEVLPPEVIRAYERSISGIMETYKTALLNPETGLLGIGRKFEDIGYAMDQYGRYIKILEDGTEEVVNSAKEASMVDLSLFDIFRDIMANVAIVLSPVIQNLTMVYDPLRKIADLVLGAREITGELLASFEEYYKGLEAIQKTFSGDELVNFNKIPLTLRASLAAINNMFANFGIISEDQFSANALKLESIDFDEGAMITSFLDSFMQSDLAGKIGKTIGEIVGSVLVEVAKVTGFVSGRIASANQLASGLKEGFMAVGGQQAIREIIGDVFKGLVKLLKLVWDATPWEVKALAIAGAILPAAITGLTVRLVGGIGELIAGLGNQAVNLLSKAKPKLPVPTLPKPAVVPPMSTPIVRQGAASSVAFRAMPTDTGAFPQVARPAAAPRAVGGVTVPGPAPTIPKPLAAAPKAAQGGVFANLMKNLKGFAAGLTQPMKLFGKMNLGLGIFTGVIDGIVKLLSGGDIFEALGAGAGPAIGSIIGGALLGPLGAFIGGWIGSLKPVTDTFEGVFRGLWEGLSAGWAAISPIITTLGQIFGDLFNIVKGIIPGADALGSSINMLDAAFIGVKIALTPFVGILNGVAAALQVLRLAILYVDKTINKLFQFGDRQGRIQAEIEKTQAALAETGLRQAEWNEKVLQGVTKPEPPKPASTEPTPPTATTPPVKPAPAPAVPATPQPVQIESFGDIAALVRDRIAMAPTTLANEAAARAAANEERQKQRFEWLGNLFKRKEDTKTGPTGEPKAPAELKAVVGNVEKLGTKVSEQTAKVESSAAALSNMSSSLSSIYSLLASGSLQVQSSTQFNMPGFTNFPSVPSSPSSSYPTVPNKPQPSGIFNWAKGGLGDAVASEMKNKPYGSDLVIANTSETVIPAAGGYGMEEFINTTRLGFQTVGALAKAVDLSSSDGRTWNNSNEETNMVNNITINQQPGQSTEDLAYQVVRAIEESMQESRAASIFV